MIEARRSSSLSLPIKSVKVQLSRLNKNIKNIKRRSDQELSSPVVVKKLRVESVSCEGSNTSDHRLTPPNTPAPEILFGVEDDHKDRDEDRALEAATFFDLPTPDVMKAFPQSGHQLKIKSETSTPSSSLNTPQITVTSSGQILHPLATTDAMRGSNTYSNLTPYLDDDTEGDMNITGAIDGSLNTPNVDLSGNNPFIFNNPFNQQPLLSHQPSRTNFPLLATHTVVAVTQPLSIDVQEQNQMAYSTSCEPSPSDQALEYAPPPYQQQQQETSYTEMQVQQRAHHIIQDLPVTVAEHCRYSPSPSAVPSPAPSNESSMASSSSTANQDQFTADNFMLSSRGSLGRKGSDASNCSAGSRARKTKKQQFTELVQRQQYLIQHNAQLRNQLKCYERGCSKLKLMLLEKMKNAARMC